MLSYAETYKAKVRNQNNGNPYPPSRVNFTTIRGVIGNSKGIPATSNHHHSNEYVEPLNQSNSNEDAEPLNQSTKLKSLDEMIDEMLDEVRCINKAFWEYSLERTEANYNKLLSECEL